MPFEFIPTVVNANTSTGNQDITTTDAGGNTPSAVLFIYGRSDILGTADNDAGIGMGAADGTNEWAFWTGSDHNLANTYVKRRDVTDQCIIIQNNGSSRAVDGEASFVSFITNGVRINWGNAPSDDWLIQAIFLVGTGSVAVGTYAAGTTVNGDTSVTAPGFEPTGGIFGTVGDNFADSPEEFGLMTLGFWGYDGVDHVQHCVMWNEWNNQTSGTPAARVQSDRVCGSMAIGAGSIFYAVEITAVGASGFTSTLRTASSGTDEIGYLVFDDTEVEIGSFQYPTSTGNNSVTGLNGTPSTVLLGCSQAAALDTGETDQHGGTIGFGAFTVNAENFTSIQVEDASATTDTQSITKSTAIILPNDDGTAGIEASFVSMDSAGFTLNYSAVTGTAQYGIYMAVYANVINATGSITPTGSLLQDVLIGVSGALTPSGTATVSFVATETFLGSLTPSGLLSYAITYVRTLLGSITPTGNLTLNPQINLEGNLTPAGDGSVFTFTVIDEEIPTEEYTYIEQIKYTEPYGLQITGSDDDRLSQFLAQKGYYSADDIENIVSTNFHTKNTSINTRGGTLSLIYPPEEEGGLVPRFGVIFWPPDAGEIPLGWIVYEPGQGNFLIGYDNVNFFLLTDGGALTYNLAHTHSSSFTVSSDAHTHGVGSYITNSDAHTHGVGSYITNSDAHTHGVGTYVNATDGHNHASSFTVSSESHTHGAGTYSIGTPTSTSLGGDAGSVASSTHSHALSGLTQSDSHSHSLSGLTQSDVHTHTISGSSASDSHSHGITSGSSSSDSHSHGITSGVSSSDSHNHSLSGSSGSSLSSTQSILPPYHVGTWIQFVGTS